jgi:hypothetical protein
MLTQDVGNEIQSFCLYFEGEIHVERSLDVVMVLAHPLMTPML